MNDEGNKMKMAAAARVRMIHPSSCVLHPSFVESSDCRQGQGECKQETRGLQTPGS
jgi:hypothetical protein